jgi:nucleoside-diphosphate-sugar epimerase
MRILLTGASGYVGGFIAAEARRSGEYVVCLARYQPKDCSEWRPFDLNAPPVELPPADALVHAAFDHLPGRYRGGEGDDPEGFLRRNRDGTLALFEAAVRSGIGRIVFLSSRAVYGPHPEGTRLTEALPPAPDTLYGQMKFDVERALVEMAGPGCVTVSLRATGVYGQHRPGHWHKWKELFGDYESGRPIAPRAGTEVHGLDLAEAVVCVLEAPAEAVSGQAFNVSDLMVDRRDLLIRYAELCGIVRALPPHADNLPNEMDCARLRNLGWAPGGWPRLERFLSDLTA